MEDPGCLLQECKRFLTPEMQEISRGGRGGSKSRRRENLVSSLAQNLGPSLWDPVALRRERKPPGWVRRLRENKWVHGEGERTWGAWRHPGSVPKKPGTAAPSCLAHLHLGCGGVFASLAMIELATMSLTLLLIHSISIYSARNLIPSLS